MLLMSRNFLEQLGDALNVLVLAPRLWTHRTALPLSRFLTSSVLLFFRNPRQFLQLQLQLLQTRRHGSSSQQRKGHISLCHPILSNSSCVVEDHSRASRRPNLQACKEGCYSVSDRRRSQRFAWHRTSQGCYWYVQQSPCDL